MSVITYDISVLLRILPWKTCYLVYGEMVGGWGGGGGTMEISHLLFADDTILFCEVEIRVKLSKSELGNRGSKKDNRACVNPVL